jgi:hypothetical protein
MSSQAERFKALYDEMLAELRGEREPSAPLPSLPEDEKGEQDELRRACGLAARMTRAFALATEDAARAHAASGVATVGVDRHGNIVRREPDGTRTVLVRAEDHLPAGKHRS